MQVSHVTNGFYVMDKRKHRLPALTVGGLPQNLLPLRVCGKQPCCFVGGVRVRLWVTVVRFCACASLGSTHGIGAVCPGVSGMSCRWQEVTLSTQGHRPLLWVRGALSSCAWPAPSPQRSWHGAVALSARHSVLGMWLAEPRRLGVTVQVVSRLTVGSQQPCHYQGLASSPLLPQPRLAFRWLSPLVGRGGGPAAGLLGRCPVDGASFSSWASVLADSFPQQQGGGGPAWGQQTSPQPVQLSPSKCTYSGVTVPVCVCVTYGCPCARQQQGASCRPFTLRVF